MKFAELDLGDTFSTEVFIDEDYVKRFAELTGDKNPIHLNEEFAKGSIFGQRIIHGMIVGAVFSKTIASEFPGPGSIYLYQDMSFLAPIYLNSLLNIEFRVISLKSDKKIIEIETKCFVASEMKVKGKALIKCLN
ncbi:MAG: MaoC family dehydratase [Saprospiraceae bacterium]|nr:MaoC family dehydratase [Saprospiraceae bacterium]